MATELRGGGDAPRAATRTLASEVLPFLVDLRGKAGKIKTMLCGPCSQQSVDNPNLKSCAARAAWLGNDEAHCVRKCEDKDLADRKRLLGLTRHWISMQFLTVQHEEKKQPKKATR